MYSSKNNKNRCDSSGKDESLAMILNPKKRKFEPKMLVRLPVENFIEKYQYPKTRIFTFWVNLS
jgi:hypothetical protein